MSEFEFISVFVSIVVAFAMAELLMGWGRMIRSYHDVKRPLFFIGWTLWLLLMMAFHYLGIWEYQAMKFHTVGQLVLMLLPPICLVLLTFILAPERSRGQPIDLEVHYFDVKNWFFGLAILFLVLGWVADAMLPDFADTWRSRIVLPFLIIATMGLVMLTKNRKLHVFVMVFNVWYLIVGSVFQNVRGF
ncbi:MAG: hypothetical protein RLZZ385_2105 [Pseudomonadota bacterium]|jgi:hypothetical protein